MSKWYICVDEWKEDGICFRIYNDTGKEIIKATAYVAEEVISICEMMSIRIDDIDIEKLNNYKIWKYQEEIKELEKKIKEIEE